MPAPKSPKTGFGLTTQSSLAVREARLARAYGEDGRARDAPPTARRAKKDDAPRALRLSLGEEAGTVRARSCKTWARAAEDDGNCDVVTPVRAPSLPAEPCSTTRLAKDAWSG